ncbi:UNVERIFIED_CONTAM: hypothetical protein K2H54_036239 [Gekko kuhli]
MQKAASSCGLPLARPREGCRRCGLTGWYGQLVPEAAICSLCTVSVEQRIRAEQAWRQQKAFQDSLFRFQDWLWAAEVTAASANSSQVSYANSKKELQRFEGRLCETTAPSHPRERIVRSAGGFEMNLRHFGKVPAEFTRPEANA